MIAPVFGAAVLTLGGIWRTVFWCLVGFGLLMMITATVFVPESLPGNQRHAGGLRQSISGVGEVQPPPRSPAPAAPPLPSP
jgi:DHA1 family bicyclomycin/chloramphenicol resistance-like MFS transporter